MASSAILHVPSPSYQVQEIVILEQATVDPLANVPPPPPPKDKALVQDTRVTPEELISFSPEHDNLVLNVYDPTYT